MKTPLAASLLVLSIGIHPALSHAAWPVDGIPISAAGNFQHAPVMVSDGAGGAIIVWGDDRNGNSDIYAQRVDPSGAVLWTVDGVVLCNAAFDQSFPTIASDGSGGAIVTWQDRRGGTFLDIYAQRINASGAVQWAANGVVLCGATNHQTLPTIVADGSSGAIVTWEDFRGGAFNDIYTQRISALGLVQWTANGVALCTAANEQIVPTLDSDGSGGAIVAWQDLRSSTNDIYAQRIDATGAVQWTANGVVICNALNGQFGPLVTANGTDGAIIVWNDLRSAVTTSDIYAQWVKANGVVQLATNGAALCTAIEDQFVKMVAPDGSGGVIAAWWDRRTGAYDVYARRITAIGAPVWAPNGVAVCTATEEQGIPAIVADGAGGAVVTWHDNRTPSSAFNIYAQRIDTAGSIQWAPDGVALCTANRNQVSPAIAPDGTGGAIVAWQDLRNGNENNDDDDIYAQRVTGSGGIPTAVRPIMPAVNLSVGASYPNPFTAGASFDVTLRGESAVSVEVFDVAGRRVRSIDAGRMPAGASRLSFDGRDDRARALPSGVYFYRVHAGAETVTKKMVIAR